MVNAATYASVFGPAPNAQATYISRRYPITRASITEVISSSVAENALCWCDGRRLRSSLAIRLGLVSPAWDEEEYGMKLRFYTQEHSPSALLSVCNQVQGTSRRLLRPATLSVLTLSNP